MYKKYCDIVLLTWTILFVLFSQQVYALHAERADKFINALLTDQALDDFIDQQAMSWSRRLGIQYVGNFKFLIADEIDKQVVEKLFLNNHDYTIEIQELEDHFFRLDFRIESLQYTKSYYFHQDYLVPAVKYHCRNWQIVDSKYFRFHISKAYQFNSFCMQNLDSFFDKMAEKLAFTPKQIRLIQEQKIDYFLCQNTNEINLITGFNIRGMYNLAFDYIITTYNAHYHELVHLLINYKLQFLPLYTHPFFQEGVAVALGGRGGKEPHIIHELGSFLYQSGFVDYQEILTKSDFNQLDASMSYPASGLYHLFLLEKLGVAKYLELYRHYSGTAMDVNLMKVDIHELPAVQEWQAFIADCNATKSICFQGPGIHADTLINIESAMVLVDDVNFYVQMTDTLLIPCDHADVHYSSKYSELLPDREYNGEKYLVVADSGEISVYNLYTNNLAASYVSGFTIPSEPVPVRDGQYMFSINKHVLK